MMYNILFIDIDDKLKSTISYFFNKNKWKISYKAGPSKNFLEGWDMLVVNGDSKRYKTTRLIIDIRNKSKLPIIVVSKDEDRLKKLMCFKYGVDDYLVEPVDVLELEYRIEAILKRVNYKLEGEEDYAFNMDGFRIDLLAKKVYYQGKDLKFTSREFDIFFLLIKKRKVYSRAEVLKNIWKLEEEVETRAVDMHIRNIRGKISRLTSEEFIKTKWGEGYYYKKLD